MEMPVNKAVLNSLTEAEWLLVQETERSELAQLNEDELLALHTRVQRARTKYVQQYRRGASAAVAGRGGRGLSYAKNQRARDKSEVFEEALARVSRQVSVVARQSSAELRAERLATARANRGKGPRDTNGSEAVSAKPSTKRRATKTTGGRKRDASSLAKGARRQAKRDAR